MTRRLVVVSAGLGHPSTTRLLADRLAAAAEQALHELGEDTATTVLELRDHARGITNRLLTSSGGPELETAIGAVGSAHGLIAVTPVFSASYSGLFKMFFDVVEPDLLRDLPVLIAATAGTPRHSLVLEHAMRPLFTYLKAAVVGTAVFAAGPDWSGAQGGDLDTRIARAARELGAAMISDTRDRSADEFVPFDRLLGGGG